MYVSIRGTWSTQSDEAHHEAVRSVHDHECTSQGVRIGPRNRAWHVLNSNKLYFVSSGHSVVVRGLHFCTGQERKFALRRVHAMCPAVTGAVEVPDTTFNIVRG